MKRSRQEPATGYVAPDHTARTLAIAAGVGAASIGVAWKFKDRFIKMGENNLRSEQAAARAEASLQRAAKSVIPGEFHRAAEKEMVTHEETLRSAASKFQPGKIEHEFVTKARNFQTVALMKHNEQLKAVPQKRDWVYYSEPFDAENPPRAGRMVPPDMSQKLKERWSMRRAKKMHEQHISTEQNKQLKGTLSKTTLNRIVHRLVELDISLKEGRGANGKFTSGGGMPLSPRDMQNAYHEPVLRRQKQSEEPKKTGTGTKVAIAGIGAALGLATLGIASPALRRRVLNQAVADTEGGVVESTGTKLAKGTREALDFAHTSQLTALRKQHAAEVESIQSRHAVEIANRVGDLTVSRDEAKRQAVVQGAARMAEAGQREAAEAKNVGLRAANETYQKVAEEKLATPLLGPTGAPANAAARAQQGYLVDTHGEQIVSRQGASEKLRARLAGHPDHPTESGRLGHIGSTKRRIANLEGKLNEAITMKASSFNINSIKGKIAAQRVLLSDHTETLRRIDSGEISHPEMIGKLLDPTARRTQQDAAHESLKTKIKEDTRKATQSFKAHQESLRKQEKDTAAKLRQDKEDTSSMPGWTGHDYHGKAPKSKNKRTFSDERLATRLCRALGDVTELSSFVRDIEVKHLPAEVQDNIRRFVKVRPGTKVSHYSMVADELIGKADPHNLSTARVNVARTMNQKEAANEVYKRRETKPVLVMNDRVIDGHHFIGKAVHGKVSTSLHVYDLTPARFQ